MEHSSSCNRAKWEVWLLDIPLVACFQYTDHSRSQWIDNCHKHKPFLTAVGSSVSGLGSFLWCSGVGAVFLYLAHQQFRSASTIACPPYYSLDLSVICNPGSRVILLVLHSHWQKIVNDTGWGLLPTETHKPPPMFGNDLLVTTAAEDLSAV